MSRRELIGRKIAKARKELGLSQSKVSEMTGIDKANISKIERGLMNATIDSIEKLCQAVGVDLRIVKGNKIFEDLVFLKHPFHLLAEQMGESYPNYQSNRTCYQAQAGFANGLNISVVIGEPFLSNGQDTYEVSLWAENGYQEIFGHLTDVQVNLIMEFSQIADIELLHYLQCNGFGRNDNPNAVLSYIKKYKDWYIYVQPCGDPLIAASKEPCNFTHIIQHKDFNSIKSRLENLDQYIEFIQEAKKRELP